jgi:CRP/FNR family transcriptional regulator
VNDIAFKRIDERLVSLLHKKRELTGSSILNIIHKQLANELGTARVVVSRLSKQL